MRIAILTFHRANNYGAVLQSYALETTLNHMKNVECEILDYKNAYIHKAYKTWRLGSLKHPKGMLRNFCCIPRRMRLNKVFTEFRSKYLKISKHTYNNKNIVESTNQYDLFITGSDQVWNGRLTDYDRTYFLDFVSCREKKWSYAASFGSDRLESSEIVALKPLLSDFHKITVREDSAKELLQNEFHVESQVLIDPTLLLSRSEWEQIVKEPKDGNYILLFLMNESNNLVNIAQRYAKENDKRLVFINLYSVGMMSETKVLTGVSVDEWLGYIRNADCIFANSYHALVFSIIFQKEFFYERQTSHNAPNSRFDSLFNRLCIGNRCIKNYEDIAACDKLEYSNIEKIQKQLQQHAIQFLRKELEICK